MSDHQVGALSRIRGRTRPDSARALMSASALALSVLLASCTEQDSGAARQSAAEQQRESESSPADGNTSQPDTDAIRQRAMPARPRTARVAARQLRVTERVILDPSASDGELRAAAHQQQVTYRVVGLHPGWDGRVLARVPAALRPSVRDNLASRREFLSMHTQLSDTLPAWRIVKPAPVTDLRRHYRAAERRFGVNWEHLAAINLIETGMGRIRGTSVAGARGPMQFIPATWARYGRGDINDPRDAIMAAARYLDARGFGRRGGVQRALYSYNNHPAYVRGIQRIARVLKREPRALRGYYHWQIYYRSTAGDVLLPVGYERRTPIKATRYLRQQERDR